MLRFVDGCLVVDYVNRDSRTIEQIRQEYADDPTVLAIDRPVAAAVDLFEASLADPDEASLADPDLALQWHLESSHLDAGSLMSGWRSGERVTVAVLDTGVDGSHPDLEANLLTGFGGTSGDGQRDRHGHGTHVAGIIAAEADNAMYGAGIAPQASLLPITVIEDDESHETIEPLIAAVNNGARVINMSYAYMDEHDMVMDQPYATHLAAIEIAHSADIVLVASAGNCGASQMDSDCTYADQTQYPAAYDHVIAVAAATSSGAPADFSTSNHAVDIAAPGVEIYSTWNGDSSCLSDSRFKSNNGDCTMVSLSGTSMAAPMVSAVAAHLVSRFPSATSDQVEQALVSTAENPHALVGLGSGIVSPLAAIDYLTTTLRTLEPEPIPEPIHEPEPIPEPIHEPEPGRSVTILLSTSTEERRPECQADECELLTVAAQGFGPGSHSVECWARHHPQATAERYRTLTTETWPVTDGCYFRHDHHAVWVIVEGVRSNTLSRPIRTGPEPAL